MLSMVNGNVLVVFVMVVEGVVLVMIFNDCYEIIVIGNIFIVKVKKIYGDFFVGQVYDDDFYIKVKNLMVYFKLI